jgi:hypothetical protein
MKRKPEARMTKFTCNEIHALFFNHHLWQNGCFWALSFLRWFSGIYFESDMRCFLFEFLTVIFFTEPGRQSCVQPPTWRTRSPYVSSPMTEWPSYTPRHEVPFSSPSATLRATVEAFEQTSTRVSEYATYWSYNETTGISSSSTEACCSVPDFKSVSVFFSFAFQDLCFLSDCISKHV